MVNKHSFLADFTVFQKTEREKQYLKKLKTAWRKNMKAFYGEDWKKHNNYPFKLKDR